MKLALSKKNLWNKMPPRLKTTLGRGLGCMPTLWFLGSGFRANCKFVRNAQWWPSQRSREYQLNKLREILSLAYEKSRFYRRMFDFVGFHLGDLNGLDSMKQLFTIDKQVVIANISDMCTKSVDDRDVEFVSTGGTGGTPLHFYINTNRSSVEYTYLTMSWERAGYELSIPMNVLRGRTIPLDRNGLRYEYDPILRHHYYSSFHMSEQDLKQYLGHIASTGPCFLHVYPSTVAALARFMVRSGTPAPKNIKGIIAESEIVYPEQRNMVEEVFQCRYFSCYGHTEKLVLAAGCEHSDDYHVWPTYGYFELIDEEDNTVTTPGQRGEIVGTGFINTVMPFIRYRTGDWATYVGERCEACGREHTIIRDIRGHRTQEVLIAADGSEIPWTALNMHDDTFIRVRQFQFLQETPGKAVLRVMPASGFSEDDKVRMQRNLRRKLDSQLIFTIKIVDAIPLSTRGKAIYVDQKIPKEQLTLYKPISP
jgi:phenylacetate-coenzyme A ligase PaaK-like adenylate-forming protein